MTTSSSPMSHGRAESMAAQPAAAPGQAAAVVIPEGTGTAINAGGMPGLLRIDPAWCGGDLLMHEQVILPRRLVRAHWHAEVVQWSIVTEGALMFRVGDEHHLVEEGGFIWRPAGLVHAVWNPDGSPARQVEGNMRGDVMLRFYERFAELARDGQPDPEEVAALAADCGTYYNDDLTREIEKVHQVSAAAGGQP